MIMEFAYPHVVLTMHRLMSILTTVSILEVASGMILLKEMMLPHGFPKRLLQIVL